MAYLITKAKLSEIAGVSRMAISKACKPGKRLSVAMQGKYVDATHPEVKAYLKEKGKGLPPKDGAKTSTKKPPAKGRQAKKVAAPKKKAVAKKPAAKSKTKPATKKQGAPLSNLEAFVQTLPDDLRDDIRKVQYLPFIEVLNMFGSSMEFKAFGDGTKRLEEIYKLQIENKKRSGELVDRALFAIVLDLIDSTHVRLMNDGSKNMAARAAPKFKAGCEIEEVAIYFQETMSKFIKPMKDQIKRKLEEMNNE